MRRLPRRARLDFVAPERGPALAGAALCAVGLAAALATGLAFFRELDERDRLDAALAAERAAAARPRRSAPTPEALQRAAEAETIERELAIPWTRLLAELEAASDDAGASVALLMIEPDPGKQRVRITAEVRALPDALAFLRRLQQSEVLRYPMLESHERRKDDPEHPLRIKLSAEWRT